MNNQELFERLITFRHDLHQHPEISGEESETAMRVIDFITPFNPDRIFRNLGGHGLAFEFRGKEEGPTVMFRCELDGLPVEEKNNIP